MSDLGNGAGASGGGTPAMETSVVDVPDRGRFEVRLGDRVVGLASYHVENGTMALPHTEVDPSVGGRGIGSALAAGGLAAAPEGGAAGPPYCSFAQNGRGQRLNPV